jgi:hypothetical protein
VKLKKGSAQIWLVSLCFGLLSGVSISSALCFLFPEFFAELSNPPGHLAGLEEEMQSLFVMSGVLTVVCTLLVCWFLRTRLARADKASDGSSWPEKPS